MKPKEISSYVVPETVRVDTVAGETWIFNLPRTSREWSALNEAARVWADGDSQVVQDKDWRDLIAELNREDLAQVYIMAECIKGGVEDGVEYTTDGSKDEKLKAFTMLACGNGVAFNHVHLSFSAAYAGDPEAIIRRAMQKKTNSKKTKVGG